MSKTAINKFTNGLTLDTHPLVSMDTSLTNCLNGTLMTMDGNELILQNDSGNTFTNCVLPSGFIPIGMKEYNGVIYIVSKNKDTGECAIGSYPSPNYSRKGTNPVWDETVESLPTDNKVLLLDTPYTDSDYKFIAGDVINLDSFTSKIDEFNKKHKSDKFDYLIDFAGRKDRTTLYYINLYLSDNKNLYDLNYLLTETNGLYVSEFTIPSRVSGYPRVTISLNTINNIYITDYTGKSVTDEYGEQKATGSGILHLQFNDDFPIEENDNLFSDKDFRFYFEENSSDIESSIKYLDFKDNEFIYQFTISRYTADEIICDKLEIVSDLTNLGFDDIQTPELYFYNDKFQLTVDGFITEPISINYFKYINVNNSLEVTYNCLLYNFEDKGLLNIYKSTDGESLELITTKQLESITGVKSIKDTFEIENEYSFIVFTSTINDVESLIDIQYIVPYDLSVYPTLNYTNFRKDITDQDKNTGRDVEVLITPKSDSLNVTESKLLTYVNTVSIEPLKNEISFGNLNYKEKINFTFGQYNLKSEVNSFMPNLEADISAYSFNIVQSELFNNDLLINDSACIKLSTNPLDYEYSIEFPLEIGTKVCDTTQYVQIGTAVVANLSNMLTITQNENGELTINWPQISSTTTTIKRDYEGTLLNLNTQLRTYLRDHNKTFEGFVNISIVNQYSTSSNSDGTLTQSSNDSTSVLDNSTFKKLCFVKASSSSCYIFEYLNGEYHGSSLIANDYLFYSLDSPVLDSKIVTYPKYYDDLHMTSPCTLKTSGIVLNNKLITQPIYLLLNKYSSTKTEYVDNYINENVSLDAPIVIDPLSENIPDKLSYIRVSTNNSEHFIQFDDKDVMYLRYNVTKNEVETTTEKLLPLGDTGFYCTGLIKDRLWKSEGSNIWSQTNQKYYFKYGLLLTYDTYNFNKLYAK